jgi:hypothetical protein
MTELTPYSPRRRFGLATLLIVALLAAAVLDVASASRGGRFSALALARRWAPLVLAAGLCALPPVRRGVGAALGRLSRPSPRGRRWTAVAVVLLATGYLAFTAHRQGRDMNAREQDESMYLIQAQQLARGRLWMPPHPCPDFFASYFILSKPVYAAMYFPGTALAYVPAVWLGVPVWWLSLLIAGGCAGMTYRVLGELLDDGVAGLLGALLLLASLHFRHLSTMVMSHTLMLLLALAMTWAYLRWRRDGGFRLRYAALCGGLAGWAAITRPVDALAYALPLAVVVIVALYRSNAPLRRYVSTGAVAVLAGLPFVALQLILDYGVTGHVLRTPVTFYHDQHWPHVNFGYAGETQGYRVPAAPPQFQQYYDRYIVPSFTEYRRTRPLELIAVVRLPLMISVSFPAMLLAALLPLCLFELGRARGGQWAWVLTLPLFFAGYATFMFFRKHYGLVFLPPLLLLLLLGARAVERAWPRLAGTWRAFFALAVVAASVSALPEATQAIDRLAARGRAKDPGDQIYPTPILTRFHQALKRVEHKPAIVLVRHHVGDDDAWAQEPVYNTQTDYPDHAKVVRAHDLGEARNVELYRHYASHQPQRHVYRFDKRDGSMTYVGKVTDLANDR